MDARERVNRLDLHDHTVRNEQIEAVSRLNSYALVIKRQSHLSAHTKTPQL